MLCYSSDDADYEDPGPQVSPRSSQRRKEKAVQRSMIPSMPCHIIQSGLCEMKTLQSKLEEPRGKNTLRSTG